MAIMEPPRSRLQNWMVWLLIVALWLGILTASVRLFLLSQSNLLLGAIVLTSAWGVFATRHLARLPSWHTNRKLYRMAEVTLLIVVFRLVTWWLVDGFPPRDMLMTILVDPWQILTPSWVLVCFFGLSSWMWAITITAILQRIELTDVEIDFFNTPNNSERNWHDLPLRINRTALLNLLRSWWLVGALILVLCTALTALPLREIGIELAVRGVGRLPMPPSMLLSLLLYLFVGFWLIGYARYLVLFARWMANDVKPHASVDRSWRRQSLVLLGLIGLVASLLPIGSTFALSRVVQTLVWAVQVGIVMIAAFISGLLARLFGSAEAAPFEAPEPVVEPLPPQFFGPPQDLPPSNPEIIPPEAAGAMFWLLALAVVGAALVYLLYERGYTPRMTTVAQWWRTLLAALRALWRGVRDRSAELQLAIREQLAREPEAADRATNQRFFRINSLTPREQIRYFYLSTVRRAGEQGLQRRKSETPAEFLARLEQEWPQSAEDSESLTDAFNAARYSSAEIDDSQAAKASWRRVRSNIRKRRDS